LGKFYITIRDLAQLEGVVSARHRFFFDSCHAEQAKSSVLNGFFGQSSRTGCDDCWVFAPVGPIRAARFLAASCHEDACALTPRLTGGNCTNRQAVVIAATISRPRMGDQIPAANIIIAVRARRVMLAVQAMIRREKRSSVRSRPTIAAVGATARNKSTKTVRTAGCAIANCGPIRHSSRLRRQLARRYPKANEMPTAPAPTTTTRSALVRLADVCLTRPSRDPHTCRIY
jgi:hypothetical protein